MKAPSPIIIALSEAYCVAPVLKMAPALVEGSVKALPGFAVMLTEEPVLLEYK